MSNEKNRKLELIISYIVWSLQRHDFSSFLSIMAYHHFICLMNLYRFIKDSSKSDFFNDIAHI
jgi:hypothetical protein